MLAVTEPAWTFGWEALVALGTIGLAAVTAGLALSTRSVARATASELRASWRPVLVIDNIESPIYLRYFAGQPTGSLSFQVRNDGRGPALGVNVTVDRPRKPGADIDLGILATGDTREAVFTSVPVDVTDPPKEADLLLFMVALVCVDLNERPYLTAAALVAPREHDEPDQNGEVHVALALGHLVVREQAWNPDRPDDWQYQLTT
jgi:hypothetical protein